MPDERRSSIEIRAVESFAEMDSCVELQRAVWEFDDLALVPRRLFVVAKSVGGQIFGAWDGNALVGFALAIPGVRKGKPYLHSHMLAVSPEYRNHGIGMRLKLIQRDDALARGIEMMEWTFDPLQVKNAHFNIEKLGAIMRRYSPNFYGSSVSPVHGSLPTDRLHAEWWLRSSRVEALLSGKNLPDYAIKETVFVPYTPPVSDGTLLAPPHAPLESLLLVRHQLRNAFANDLTVLRFQSADSEESRYLLGTWVEGGSF